MPENLEDNELARAREAAFEKFIDIALQISESQRA
jgi:hypothetical protein